jgi:DNA-binding transcriptional regulator GbsR (MarR family)
MPPNCGMPIPRCGRSLVCDPPAASSQELEEALEVSRASVSVATRFLDATRLVKRRTRSGERVHRFEIDPDARKAASPEPLTLLCTTNGP